LPILEPVGRQLAECQLLGCVGVEVLRLRLPEAELELGLELAAGTVGTDLIPALSAVAERDARIVTTCTHPQPIGHASINASVSNDLGSWTPWHVSPPSYSPEIDKSSPGSLQRTEQGGTHHVHQRCRAAPSRPVVRYEKAAIGNPRP
jgi:hypothetical protein